MALIGTGGAVFLFCCLALRYTLALLTGAKGGWGLTLLWAALAAAGTLGAYALRLSLPLFTLLGLLFFLAGLMLQLRGQVMQALFGASLLAVHTSSLHILCTALLAYGLGRPTYEVYRVTELGLSSIALTCAVTALLLGLAWKLLPMEGLRTVSNTRVYASMVSAIAIFILIYTVVDHTILLSEEPFSNVTRTLVTTVVLTLLLLYTLLMYSVNSAKMVGYKRRTDELERTRQAQERYQEQLKRALERDGLTGCYNRSFILEVLRRREAQGAADFLLIFMDLNGLKDVNDAFGHEAGDRYLMEVSRAARAAVGEGDYVARIGGDEFLVVLLDRTEAEAAAAVERLRRKVAELDRSGAAHPMAVSMGATYVDAPLLAGGIDAIIQMADRDMRREKAAYYGEGGQ